MKKHKLFGSNIEPACAYCSRGEVSEDGLTVYCARKGVRELGDRCRKFEYDPLKRIPKRAPDLPAYNEDDFKL